MATNTTKSNKKHKTRGDYDSPWKHSLHFYFQDFMEFCLPHIAEQIDWSKGYEALDKDLLTITRDAEIGNRVADKIMRVSKKDGNQALILCHVEVDGDPRNKLPKRMMIYRYRIYNLHQLPIISIAILIDDNPNWRIDHYREECFDTYLEIRYLLVKLLDYKNRQQELEALNNRFSILILAQLAVLETQRDDKARLKAKTALTRQLYKKGYTKQDINQLYILVDWLITLPKELKPIYNQAVKIIEEEQHVNYITTAEELGIEKGFQRGLEVSKQYITTAEELGIEKGLRKALIHILRHRFHHIPFNYQKRIRQADADTLLLWEVRVFDAATLDEVFN